MHPVFVRLFWLVAIALAATTAMRSHAHASADGAPAVTLSTSAWTQR